MAEAQLVQSSRWSSPALERTRLVSLLAAGLSMITSLVLLAHYAVLGGPGDHVEYYQQASHLLPFVHNYYGPGYFVAIRLVHDALQLDWFSAGKLVSWLSAGAFLVFCWVLFERLLGAPTSWYAFMLVAITPTFITQSYAADTNMYGAAWSLAAIAAMASAPIGEPRRWLVPGLVFGGACLTRFQNYGLVIGALAGLLAEPSGRVATRLKCAGLLLAGAAVPTLVWQGILVMTQGYVPPNYNFVHLTIALGQFRSWYEVPDLVRRYGNFWGVLSSSRTAPFQLAAFALKEAVKFPFGLGFRLLFLGCGWLLPGATALVASPASRTPWFGAFALGLLLTGIGGRGWTQYYVMFIPFLAIIIASAIQAVGSHRTSHATLTWGLVLVTTAVWSPFVVREGFLAVNWTEFGLARQYLQASQDSTMLVSSTAGDFPYGTTLRFVDQRQIMHPEDSARLVEKLRDAGVTDLVVTERHTLYDFPDLAYLLQDSTDHVPPELQRELLIVSPMRLAIYRVLPR